MMVKCKISFKNYEGMLELQQSIDHKSNQLLLLSLLLLFFLLTLLYFCLICFIILRQDLKITGDLEVVKLQEALNSRFSCFYPPVVEITIVCIHI